jgi:hypothetical protein
MTADDRLALIRVKIKRAYQHLAELEDAVTDADETSLNTVALNFDSGSGKPVIESRPLVIYRDTVPAIAGDVSHNLRCALDHLAYQLVLVGGEPRKHKWEDIQFPIFDSPKNYDAGKIRKLEGMRREAIEAIDRLKPYKGGNNALWLLRRLDNTDKHSSILSVGFYQLVIGKTASVTLRTDEPFFTSIGSSKPNQDVNLSRNEPLVQPTIGERNALLPTLYQLAELVGDTVTKFRSLLS